MSLRARGKSFQGILLIMNKTIKTMLELQAFWNKAALSRKNIETCESDIIVWRDKAAQAEQKRLQIETNLKHREKTLKEKELELAEVEEKLKKLEKKRELIKTEREQQAFAAEAKLLQNENNLLEDDILAMMDTINETQVQLQKAQEELEQQQNESKLNIEALEKEIAINKEAGLLNQNNYDSLLAELETAHRQRFDKLINSKKGKVVGEVQGEVCGVCNFQIPVQLASEASREEKVVTCTNCGAYIYKL